MHGDWQGAAFGRQRLTCLELFRDEQGLEGRKTRALTAPLPSQPSDDRAAARDVEYQLRWSLVDYVLCASCAGETYQNSHAICGDAVCRIRQPARANMGKTFRSALAHAPCFNGVCGRIVALPFSVGRLPTFCRCRTVANVLRVGRGRGWASIAARRDAAKTGAV